jgi:hypothetical protein
MQRRVVRCTLTDVLEELTASIIRVEGEAKQETNKKSLANILEDRNSLIKADMVYTEHVVPP